jgi:hypothetical protein
MHQWVLTHDLALHPLLWVEEIPFEPEFIGNLHKHQWFLTHNLTLHPLLWEGEMPFEPEFIGGASLSIKKNYILKDIKYL